MPGQIRADRAAVLRAVDVAELTLVRLAAQHHVREVKRLMREPKHGRHWPGLPRRSSAPGEAPAVQSGRLIRAVGLEVVREGDRWVALAGVRRDVDYAVALEFGAARLAPRPAWRPALGVALGRVRQAAPRWARQMVAGLRGRAAG